MKCEEGNVGSVDVDRVLYVLRYLGVISVVVGIGGITCGILILVYSDPVWHFPFSSGSGIWSGLGVLILGLIAINITRVYSQSTPCKWVYVLQGLGHACTIMGGMHMGYSISGLVQCLGNAEEKGELKCNPLEEDNIVIVSAVSIAIGLAIFCLGLFAIIYLVTGRRGATLTNNPMFGKCRC